MEDTEPSVNVGDPALRSVHGKNPELLIEKVLRGRIYSNAYFKEHCFALTAETLVDKAVELREIGGTYGGARRPTKFMCLMLKMLSIRMEREIAIEFIRQSEYKVIFFWCNNFL